MSAIATTVVRHLHVVLVLWALTVVLVVAFGFGTD
jgi:hypothetical protein